jgi:hypothetical protein
MYYKKNFLTNVILRLDFNIQTLNINIEELKFSKDIAARYS